MKYETYKLGKMKKNPARRLYTLEELEAMDLPGLREIVRAENIKPPKMDMFHQKEELAELIYRYLGTRKKPGIEAYSREGCERLMEAFEKSGSWQGSEVEVPAQVLLYQDQSFHDMDSHYRIVSKTEPGLYAFLTDEEQKIQAVFTLEPEKRDNFMTDPDKNKTYRLHVRRERLSPEIPAGRFHHWELLLLEPESVTEAVRCYLGKERKKTMIYYHSVTLPEVWVREVPVSAEPLLIDYGTSYTTAGVCLEADRHKDSAGRHILFPRIADCEEEQSGGQYASISQPGRGGSVRERGEEKPLWQHYGTGRPERGGGLQESGEGQHCGIGRPGRGSGLQESGEEQPLWQHCGIGQPGRGGRVQESGEEQTDGWFCGLCPSVLAVKDCSDGIPEHMTFLYGEEAAREEKKRGYLTRCSVFYDMKRWAGRYRERILVTDIEGNTCEAERLFFIRAFLKHVIDQAQQLYRVRFHKLCFTCPVKQKALFLRMYQEALPEHEILMNNVTDEAAAVAYHFLEQGIRSLAYDDGVMKKILILDCGGGTSDMVNCNYRITNEGITSSLELHVTYAHGDTNFGGNRLTFRVMQYLKIRLAELLMHKEPVSMDALFPGVLVQLYEIVDNQGVEKAYEVFSQIYQNTEDLLPTRYDDYRNHPESIFLKVRSNYYFLWNLAEMVKKKLYCRPGILRIPLQPLFSDFSNTGPFTDFHLFAKRAKGGFETYTVCPKLVIEKEEIQLLLKPDIYGFLKNFIEPWYESGRLMDTDRIILSGQSSKIELFREVMKEYVPGRKAGTKRESGCERKFLCIDGAMAYQKDLRSGRIRTKLSYEPARAPYSLTAEDYETGGREKTLLEKGTPMGEAYGCLSRPVETQEVVFRLKDGMGKEVFTISYSLVRESRQETGYGQLLSDYPFLRQEDLDGMRNGELRLFIYADDASWGFSVLEAAREADRLYSRTPGFLPFEPGAWETDYFDGRH